MLSGAQAEKILCLTFTNAAASEMLERVYDRLKAWSSISKAQLQDQIQLLTGEPSNKTILSKARSLLTEQLQKLENLNIYTIHSFCQKILKQFSLEAGLAANFKILDEINHKIFLSKVKHDFISNQANHALTEQVLSCMHDVKLSQLIEEILAQRLDFLNLFNRFSSSYQYRQYLIRYLDVIDQEEIIIEAKKSFIQYSSKISSHIISEPLSELDDDFEHNFQLLKKYFLTQNNQKRKKLLSKEEIAKNPEQLDCLLEIQDLVFQTLEKLNSYKVAQSSAMIYDLAKEVIELYEKAKQGQNFLDYDDLIYYTHKLFTASEHKDWILYNLDGGIEHILVDEAQDTSINQWHLILSMINDFVSGESSSQSNKSLFIVGDEKQSIYSFQGARFEQFGIIKEQILKQLNHAQKKHHTIELTTSYRSSSVVLEAVEKILQHIRTIDTSLFASEQFALDCHFSNYGGAVELWPIYQETKTEELFWPTPQDQEIYSSISRLAQDIAKYIKDTIASQKVLFTTNKMASPGDFMILLRRRDQLANEIVKALKDEQIPVSGLDRIDIFQDLSVMDLLSAAKFTLAFSDELNLACLLKSPFFNFNDVDLYHLAYGREKNLYEQICALSEHRAIKAELDYICSIAASSKISDFFYILVYGNDNLGKFLQNNGPESIDSIHELINLAVKFETNISGNLHDFIAWCSSYNLDFKRDGAVGDVVKIMTVHAAKGLQAPIVILPDTTCVPKNSEKFLWNQDGGVIFAANSNDRCSKYTQLQELESNKQYTEYLRLLYVAITRSCEELIFCGYSNGEKINEKSWYALASNALMPFMTLKQQQDSDQTTLIMQSNFARPKAAQVKQTNRSWPLVNLSSEAGYTLKSHQLKNTPNSPFDLRPEAFYGQIVHKIFEESFAAKNIDLLLSHSLWRLAPGAYAKKAQEQIANLTEQEEFRQLYNQQLLIEVNLSFNGKLGRIDLACQTGDSITIIDYKTDQNVPQNPSAVAPKYLDQLDFYKQAVGKIYPELQVYTKILWIMEAKFMQL